jgi:signal recognition particle receptor subunit beta
VLADTRRLGDCFAGIDYFESRGMPFVVAVNPFDGQRTHDIPVIREAIQEDDNVPMLWCDARHRGDVKNGLIALVELALRRERSKQFA